MGKAKSRSGASTGSAKALSDLFRPYAIPPSPLHEAIQQAAEQAGWLPPLQRRQQEKQKVAAGKKSGAVRAQRQDLRRDFVKAAFDRLKPAHRSQPYSDHSIDALEKEYRSLLAEGGDPDLLMSAAPFKASRETLIDDLKAIGVRSTRSRSKKKGPPLARARP
jgi:hypothetical protein